MAKSLEIIPVIDVMGGKVVHARGGHRADYPLLQSVLTTSSMPLIVIEDLLAWHPFSTLYMADLDAICDQKRDIKLYQAISEHFPQLTLYIDAGIQGQQDWQQLALIPRVYPIIGSETLKHQSWVASEEVKAKSILSLDFKNNSFLGEQEILDNEHFWPDKVIAMNLDHIASQQGPDFTLLSSLQRKERQCQIIAAGGVREEKDLVALNKMGITQVLVASALHNGQIDRQLIEQLSNARNKNTASYC